MSVKTDRPQVRTAQDLERKYNFYDIETNVKQSKEGLTKVSNELYQFANAVAGDTSILQQQLDGEIDTWYGDETPTLLNNPAVQWDEAEYDNHLQDLYYDRTTGHAYSFTENNGVYSWELTSGNFLAEVLAIANKAQETADNKKVVFFEKEPEPPYDNGDLWINNKKLYVCQIAKEAGDSFDAQDFIIATDYVDGTQAQANAEAISVLGGKVTQLVATNDSFTYNFGSYDALKQLTDSFSSQLDQIDSYVKFENGNIILGKTGNTFTLKIENDKIQIYYNDKPISSWIQDRFSVSQINLGNFAFIPRDNGSLSFRKVN